MTDYLRRFLAAADQPEPTAYAYDQIVVLDPWPEGVLEFFLQLGVLKELSPSSLVWLWECVEPNWVEPEWVPIPARGGEILGLYPCEYGCGMHEIDPVRRSEWGPSVDSIVSIIARSIGCKSQPIVDVPDRVWLLGNISEQKQSRDVFLVRGATWKDFSEVLKQSGRLAASANATVLCLSHVPRPENRPTSWKMVLSLEEIASIEDGAVVIQRERLTQEMSRSLDPQPREVISDVDADVLEALASRSAETMMLVEVMEAAGYSKGTVRKAIDHLIRLELATKPAGRKRKGVCITPRGLKLLESRGFRSS